MSLYQSAPERLQEETSELIKTVGGILAYPRHEDKITLYVVGPTVLDIFCTNARVLLSFLIHEPLYSIPEAHDQITAWDYAGPLLLAQQLC
jgi:hypothetical protein